MQYFRNNRSKLLTWVKDWNDPQDHIRFAKVKEISYNDWFFCHPSAYQLISFGINYIAVFMFSFLSIYLIYSRVYFLLLIPSFMIFANAKGLINKYKNKHILKNTTFYDIWMRDYTVEVKE